MHQFFVLIDKKYLGMYLDETLNFNLHIKKEMIKALKGKNLPRHYLVTIYKSFVRPHLDCGDEIYDQPNNESFTQKIERIQWNAALAITGTIKGTSQNKLYSELGFESLKFRRWFRKLCTFLKIKTTGKPGRLFDIIQKPIIYTILAYHKMLQHFKELMISGTPFFHLQCQNGTNLIGECDNLQLRCLSEMSY